MDINNKRKMLLYQLTVLFSVVFSLLGFSYNVWRMEVTEQNNTIRTASFEILVNLADLEQLVYAAHYDKDSVQGNPRKGWVLVGLTQDLSMLTDDNVVEASHQLFSVWQSHWQTMPVKQDSVEAIVNSIDQQRSEIKQLLKTLE